MKKIKLKTVIKYSLYFALLALFCNATTPHGLKPFGLGLFVALVYARQNILILAPMYMAAAVLSEPSWLTLAAAAIPPVILTTAYYVHYKTGKSLNMFFMNLYALLAQVPCAFFAADGRQLFSVLLGVVITQIFVYVAIIIVYALVIRGLRYRFTIDELVSGAVFIAVAALGLYNISFVEINLYFVFFAFFLMLSAYNF